jgi:hypothetical protein
MKSKMYTQGGEFTTADGSEYVGFYSVVDGVAYEGRDSIG